MEMKAKEQNKLKEFMTEHKINQIALAGRVGISAVYMNQICNGHKTPGAMAGRVVNALRSLTGKHRGMLTVETIFEQVDARYVVREAVEK